MKPTNIDSYKECPNLKFNNQTLSYTYKFNYKKISKIFFIDRLLEAVKKIAYDFFGFFKDCCPGFNEKNHATQIKSPITNARSSKISKTLPAIEKVSKPLINVSGNPLPYGFSSMNHSSLNQKVNHPIVENAFKQADKSTEKSEGGPVTIVAPLQTDTNVKKNKVNHFVSDEFFKKSESEIRLEAFAFMKRSDIQKKQKGVVPNISDLGVSASDHALIDAMLENHRGFCVGENHTDPSGKKFFIENMRYFKEKGVKAIFIEGWPYQKQINIDDYMSPSLTKWPSNNPFSGTDPAPKDPRYQDHLVVEAAKKNGIRVIGMDLENDHEYIHENRLLSMNYYCYKVMQKELLQLKKEDKYIGFMGLNHVLKQSDVPSVSGVAELMECPAMSAEQSPMGIRYATYNHTHLGRSIDTGTFTLNQVIPSLPNTV